MDFDLERFVKAQDRFYSTALRELLGGHKKSHWMWFIFPQIRGLGRSETARFYAISGRSEALAYLNHSILGPRLQECTHAMLGHSYRGVYDILGSPDDLKFHSSMTLFGAVAPAGSVFEKGLEVFYEGKRDEATLAALCD